MRPEMGAHVLLYYYGTDSCGMTHDSSELRSIQFGLPGLK